MRQLLIPAAIVAAMAVCAPALAQSMLVRTDQAVRIALPGAAKDVAVGNPEIADVTVLDARNIVIIGKGPGTTNVVVLDRTGRMILDRTVVVTAADNGQVSVYRGGAVSQFSCSPACAMTGQEEPPKKPQP